MMQIDSRNNEFPPKDWQGMYESFSELATWYSGDPNRLLSYYSIDQFQATKLGYYWGMIEEEERREAVHLPLAGDIAQMSANLLFSESPQFLFDEKTKVGERIRDFIDENGMINTLLESAEMGAALSGVFLKLDYVPEVSDLPIVTVRVPQNAFPIFRSGRLFAVVFHRPVKEDESGAIWRLFEERWVENNKLHMAYSLYKGSPERFGTEVGLDSIEETKQLGLKNEVLNIPTLACIYVPNMRPNKLYPGSPIGESDYRTSIGLLDSLDFAWSSWLRDIELGLAQVVVDESVTVGGTFNKLQRVLIKLNMEPHRLAADVKYEPVKPIQFDIRVDEHMKTCDQLTRQIIGMCGYAPQTFGMTEYGQQRDSGTALRIRERKSLLTRQKKERYWIPELVRFFQQMQLFDGAKKGGIYTPEEVGFVPGDSIIQDEKEKAETLRNLETAKAVSTYMKVKMLHTDWSEDEILEEVDRIYKDNSMGVEELPYEGIS